jgi:hypothetical protein
VLMTRNSCCLRGNRMVWFAILDCLVFLLRGPSVLLVADISVMIVSYIVALIAKTLSRS